MEQPPGSVDERLPTWPYLRRPAERRFRRRFGPVMTNGPTVIVAPIASAMLHSKTTSWMEGTVGKVASLA